MVFPGIKQPFGVYECRVDMYIYIYYSVKLKMLKGILIDLIATFESDLFDCSCCWLQRLQQLKIKKRENSPTKQSWTFILSCTMVINSLFPLVT